MSKMGRFNIHRAQSLLCCLSLAAAQVFAVPVMEAVQLGNFYLRETDYDVLQGHRVAVLSNPTGAYTDSMEHIVDAMSESALVDIVAVFGPEHGFRGDKQAETGDSFVYIDKETRLPVYSAYAMNDAQLTAVLIDMNITAVVVDMQDVGVRLYTFIWTMYNLMHAFKEAASKLSVGEPLFLVLDRPNPLGGITVDGPLLNVSCCASGYGKFPITHIHGMTIGELALLFNTEVGCAAAVFPIEVDLDSTITDLKANHIRGSKDHQAVEYTGTDCVVAVMKTTGWKRDMLWRDTLLPWIPPSPNLPTANSALAYGATVFLEATSVSEGRGTTTPFELFGAPFFDAMDLVGALNAVLSSDLEQAAFRAAYFQPTYFKYENETVSGAQWFVERTMSNSAHIQSVLLQKPFGSGTAILCAARDTAQPPQAFVWDGCWFGHPGTELIDQYAGTPNYRELIDAGLAAADIASRFALDALLFSQTREPFLLYD